MKYIIILILILIKITTNTPSVANNINKYFENVKTINPHFELNEKPLFISTISVLGDRLLLGSNSLNTLYLLNSSFTNYDNKWQLNSSPTGVTSTSDMIFVTTQKGSLYAINLTNDDIRIVQLEDGARHPIINGNTIYVLEQFNNTIAQIDKNSLKVIKRINVPREPKVATLNSNGTLLFVANFLPKQRADIDHVASDISIIDTKTMKEVKRIKLVNGSNALRGISLSADDKYIFVSHNLGRYTVPTSQLQQGWMNTSAMSIINANTLEYIGAIILDEPERGAAGIWDIKTTADKIFISHSGTHDISVIDYPMFINKLESYTGDLEALSYDLSFLYGIRERVPLIGNAPRDMTLLDNKLIIPTYFSDTLNILNVNTNEITIIPLVKNRTETLVQTGEKYFNDAAYCFQNWQSCNGCHPGEGRSDGLNWDLLNDGIGNSKNCKSLLYSIQTPPSMITGIRENAIVSNRKGFVHIQFYNIPESKALAIDAYTQSLKALPSPHLINGKFSAEAKDGEKVFYEQNCHQCHSGQYYTDLKRHRIGENIEFEQGWDTPTLKEVWRTAPYLFDGRAEDIFDVFDTYKHGITKKISKKKMKALSQYVLSL